MGATTLRGRSRNRRVVSPSSPPRGFPVLLAISPRSIASENELLWYSLDVTGQPSVDFALLPDARLRFFDPNLQAVVTASVVAENDGFGLRAVFDTPYPNGASVILLPWQPAIRGANGEWLSSAEMIFTS